MNNKLYSTFFAAFCFFLSCNAFSQNKILNSSIEVYFDNNSEIMFGDSTSYAYNSVSEQAEQLYGWGWVSTVPHWAPNLRWIDREYDTNGNNTYFRLQYTDGVHGWLNKTRSSSTYDDESHVLTNVQDEWLGFWHPSIHYSAMYDADSKKLFESWDTYRYTYTYDAQGLLMETLKETVGFDSLWAITNKTDYEYENDGKTVIAIDYAYWNNWFEQAKTTSTYDEFGNLVQSLSQKWNNGTWINYVLSTYQYDPLGNVTNSFYQIWEGNAVKEYGRLKYTYDNDFNPLEILTESSVGNGWHKSRLLRYYYSENTLAPEPKKLSLQFFPNPASSVLFLQGNDLAHLNIYSQEGKLMRAQRLTGNSRQIIPLDLPDGHYLLQVSDAHGNVDTKTLQVIH